MSGQEFLPEATVTRVAALQTAAQVQGFWSGVAVWVDKPHVVNRRLTGAKELARIWTNGTVISTLLQNPKVLLAKESSEGSLQKRLEELKMEGRNEAEGDDLELIVRDLLPRQLERAEVVREGSLGKGVKSAISDCPVCVGKGVKSAISDCPVCVGKGVKSAISDCPVCVGKGVKSAISDCLVCVGKGVKSAISDCPVCVGKGVKSAISDCPVCVGKGVKSAISDCLVCVGKGVKSAISDCPGVKSAISDCPVCVGKGVKSAISDCLVCGGKGVKSAISDCPVCVGKGVKSAISDCLVCGGKGVKSAIFDCPVCVDHPQTCAWFVPLGVSRPDDPDSGSELSYKSYRFVFSEEDSGTGKTYVTHILSPPEASASVHSGGNCSTGGADVQCPNDDGICSPTTKWLCDHLLPKIAKWSEETVAKGNRRRVQELVPIDRYNVRYQQLKRRYGRRMIQIWPDVTSTDPEKFVYEDIALATYLLLFVGGGENEAGTGEEQSFVDLGCGNGLLVYILSQEGHPGKGIDVRKRTTWDIYGPDTVLQEEPITPSDSCLFPDSDWLIGNHSDELTPWIPVIAARSSYATRYFVLPCCPFDFHGKFARTHTATSHYRNYLDYVRSVGQACGFRVEEDSLRIPSTKRICHIGRTRVYPEDETHKIDQLISDFINSRPREQPKNPHNSQTDIRGATTECLVGNGNVLSDDPSADAKLTSDQGRSEVGGPTGSGSALWVDGFQPRSKVEVVRNCNRLEEGLKDRIVNTVGLALLNQHPGNNKQINKQATGNTESATSAGNTESATSAGNTESATSSENRAWNKGGSLQMSEVVAMFDKETLQKLKCECGGLKTLLKNKNQVFILRGDSVRLRDWSLEEAGADKSASSTNRRRGKKKKRTDRDLRVKTSLCWFYLHHPDGCPRLAQDCYYAHGQAELRNKIGK
ncbi:tRNA methyltransferase 44 [Branchiostoma belcheri]|nr:tRNA methyltransferase 44 [Branchiostoma belcheri]